MPPLLEEPISLTPEQYEREVKRILDAASTGLVAYESKHLDSVSGMDGEYVIDVTVRFSALGDAAFFVLVECKHEKRKVERQVVQILLQKVQSTSANKGMIFSISGFQKGAIEFAKKHGISLVHLANGNSAWCTKSMGPKAPPPSWAAHPNYVGWWCDGNSMSIMSAEDSEYTREALGLPTL
jgi:restriction system protein